MKATVGRGAQTFFRGPSREELYAMKKTKEVQPDEQSRESSHGRRAAEESELPTRRGAPYLIRGVTLKATVCVLRPTPLSVVVLKQAYS